MKDLVKIFSCIGRKRMNAMSLRSAFCCEVNSDQQKLYKAARYTSFLALTPKEKYSLKLNSFFIFWNWIDTKNLQWIQEYITYLQNVRKFSSPKWVDFYEIVEKYSLNETDIGNSSK
jgi:hypothetical protein